MIYSNTPWFPPHLPKGGLKTSRIMEQNIQAEEFVNYISGIIIFKKK